MMWFIYKYRMKALLRGRENLFWCLGFPIILATFFGLAFSNLMSANFFSTVPVGLVKTDIAEQTVMLENALTEAKNGDTKLFSLKVYDDSDTAKAALDEKEITGVYMFDPDLTLMISDTGINQTIAKEFGDRFLQTEAVIMRVISEDPQRAQEVAGALETMPDYMTTQTTGHGEPDFVLGYFYALIAMTCLYGGYLGVQEVVVIEANQSATGARIQASPVKKSRLYIAGMAAASTVHMASVLLLILYLIFVQKIDFGNQIGFILAACAVGSMTGVAFGAFIGSVLKKSEGAKYATMTGLAMLMSFGAGLMMHHIRYLIITNVPILGYINPANLIADMFYSLYYYPTYERYFFNMGFLVVITVVFYAIVFLIARRRQYASI